MNPLFRNYLLILGLLVILVLVLTPSVNKNNIDWSLSFTPNNKAPFGTYILNQEIDDFFGKDNVERYDITPYEFLSEQKDTLQNYNFMFINQSIDQTSMDKIMHLVENGSHVLLVSPSFGILDDLQIGVSYKQRQETDTISFELTTQSLTHKIFKINPIDDFKTFTKYDTNRTKILGFSYYKKQKNINFIEVTHGKGKFFIHLNPIVFSNYFLKQNNFDQYTASVLAYLPQNNKLIWFDKHFNQKVSTEEVPKHFLSVIFSYPSLAMGWRIFIIGTLLFVIFQGKRKQRIIPIINKEKNTTIEFAQTIGNLYYQQGNTTDLVQKKITYFLDNVRNRFYIDTQQIDNVFLHKLQQKSNQTELSNQIVFFIQTFQKNQVADQSFLVELDKLITDFWKMVK